jgi:hypothetical protein
MPHELHLTEKGRALNSNNETYLRQAAKLLVKVIKSIKQADPFDAIDTDDDATDATTKEAGTFNQSDTMTLLQDALRKAVGGNSYDTYICDVYEDQSYFIYRKGYSGGYFKIDFAVDANGIVTLSTPIEVVRKVTYIVPAISTSEALRETELLEDTVPVQLVEKAVASDGTVMLKLIAPGRGSSGYYTEEVLKRDGPKVFTKGLHNFIDHPTPQEEAERPEGSIGRLGSTLVEDARWLDRYHDKDNLDAGPGLYARAKVSPAFRENLDAIAGNIGTSIRASGKARIGQIGDFKGPIIETITHAKSVDYVTMPGAGGKVLSLVESARQAQQRSVDDMGTTEEITALRETVQGLTSSVVAMREAMARSQAPAIIAGFLAPHTNVPEPIKARIVAKLMGNVPLTESKDAIDVVALGPLVETAVKDELAYVQQIGAAVGFGAITGFGSTDPLTESDPTKNAQAIEDDIATLFASPVFGMSEAAAKIAAKGR